MSMDVRLSVRERAPIDLLISRVLLVELDGDLVALLRQPEIRSVLQAVEPGVGTALEWPWTAARGNTIRLLVGCVRWGSEGWKKKLKNKK